MNMYTPPQVEKLLKDMKIYVDTREQDTAALHGRIEGFNSPSERRKLDVGDYGVLHIENGAECLIAAIERKQGLSELCTNFTNGRDRFKKEFERAKAAGTKMHLLIEDDNYEKLFAHKYRSNLLPQSLIASLLSWSVRYNISVHFCKAEISGKLIKEILHYEYREYLINL